MIELPSPLDSTNDDVPASRRHHYSLRLGFLGLTLACIYFAIPGGVNVFWTVGGWVVIGLITVGGLALIQYPIYLLLQRISKAECAPTTPNVGVPATSKDVRHGSREI